LDEVVRAAAASNSLRERLLKTPRFFAAKPLSRFLDFCTAQHSRVSDPFERRESRMTFERFIVLSNKMLKGLYFGFATTAYIIVIIWSAIRRKPFRLKRPTDNNFPETLFGQFPERL
jgi:hypothetical protein